MTDSGHRVNPLPIEERVRSGLHAVAAPISPASTWDELVARLNEPVDIVIDFEIDDDLDAVQGVASVDVMTAESPRRGWLGLVAAAVLAVLAVSAGLWAATTSRDEASVTTDSGDGGPPSYLLSGIDSRRVPVLYDELITGEDHLFTDRGGPAERVVRLSRMDRQDGIWTAFFSSYMAVPTVPIDSATGLAASGAELGEVAGHPTVTWLDGDSLYLVTGVGLEPADVVGWASGWLDSTLDETAAERGFDRLPLPETMDWVTYDLSARDSAVATRRATSLNALEAQSMIFRPDDHPLQEFVDIAVGGRPGLYDSESQELHVLYAEPTTDGPSAETVGTVVTVFGRTLADALDRAATVVEVSSEEFAAAVTASSPDAFGTVTNCTDVLDLMESSYVASVGSPLWAAAQSGLRPLVRPADQEAFDRLIVEATAARRSGRGVPDELVDQAVAYRDGVKTSRACAYDATLRFEPGRPVLEPNIDGSPGVTVLFDTEDDRAAILRATERTREIHLRLGPDRSVVANPRVESLDALVVYGLVDEQVVELTVRAGDDEVIVTDKIVWRGTAADPTGDAERGEVGAFAVYFAEPTRWAATVTATRRDGSVEQIEVPGF